MGKSPIYIKEVVRASHLVMMGYGHWLPNDPRGSGSIGVWKPEFRDLGPAHFGRKEDQPTRDELRKFFREAEPLLNHPIRWFEEETRQSIACAFAEVVKLFGYTVYACAILRNHAHLVVRTHKSDKSETMWDHFTQSAAEMLRGSSAFGDDHPVWSKRPYKVYLKSPA